MKESFPEGTNFTDMKKKKQSDYDFGHESVECPLCHGYGGWIDRLNFYKDGSHSKFSCRQCNGWGYVEKGSKDETCIHDMVHTKNLGNCYNEYKCSKCGQVERIDSSG